MSAQGVSLRTRGMHCPGCEHIIEESVRELPGIERVEADYSSETVAVVFETASTTIEQICAAIAQKGYRCSPPDAREAPRSRFRALAGLVLGVAGVSMLVLLDTEMISKTGIPDATRPMSYGLILILGVLTGFHCVGMCGGFVLSYTADAARLGKNPYVSHGLYGAGKTLSYTAIGAMFGLLGAVITFTPLLRGMAGLCAGAFLIVFGLNMLGLFTPLRKIRLNIPDTLARFIGRTTKSTHRPFAIGLLNGLMIACGPLQAMYVMAAGTGSAVEGAKMLFTFGIGTLPVLLSFGVLTSLISAALTHRLLRTSGAIVVILGIVMINRGMILIGSGYDLRSLLSSLSRPGQPELAHSIGAQPAQGIQTITMEVNRSGFSPNHFVLRRGVPVRWIITGREITTCNRRIVVPALGLEFDIEEGSRTIEFTPTVAGVIPWSCWMGMLHGDFVVVDEEQATAGVSPPMRSEAPALPPEVPPAPVARQPPALAAAEPAMSAHAVADTMKTYKVAPKDTLSKIAAIVYGDPRAWPAIARANPGLDPRRLQPGSVIKLPRPAAKAEPTPE